MSLKIKYLIKLVVSIFLSFTQKFVRVENYGLIHSFPDFDDMTRSILESDLCVFDKWIVLVSDDFVPGWVGPLDVTIVKKNSLCGLYCFLKSKYIFFTHGLYVSGARPPGGKVYVNLWHGMPLKNIAHLDLKSSNVVPYSDVALSTSRLFQGVMSKAFNLDGEKVLNVGLPRNDLLNNLNVKKKVLWMPTYRQSDKLDVRCDGVVMKDYFGLSQDEIIELNSIFSEFDYKLYIKPHPMDSVDVELSLSHIEIIDNEYLGASGVSLYEFLSECSFLISDVSSVVIDFWLTERPIVIFFPDFKEYSESRGLTLDLDFESIFGPFFVQNKGRFLSVIKKILSGDILWANKWNDFGLNDVRYGASERLLKKIKSDIDCE